MIILQITAMIIRLYLALAMPPPVPPYAICFDLLSLRLIFERALIVLNHAPGGSAGGTFRSLDADEAHNMKK